MIKEMEDSLVDVIKAGKNQKEKELTVEEIDKEISEYRQKIYDLSYKREKLVLKNNDLRGKFVKFTKGNYEDYYCYMYELVCITHKTEEIYYNAVAFRYSDTEYLDCNYMKYDAMMQMDFRIYDLLAYIKNGTIVEITEKEFNDAYDEMLSHAKKMFTECMECVKDKIEEDNKDKEKEE